MFNSILFYKDDSDRRDSRVELTRIVKGDTPPPCGCRRLIAGIASGLVVGFVEAGIWPKRRSEWFALLCYLVVRIATGAACALVPWRVHAILRGVVFGVLLTVPLLLLSQPKFYPRLLLFGSLAGMLIGYWTERFGVPRQRPPEDALPEG